MSTARGLGNLRGGVLACAALLLCAGGRPVHADEDSPAALTASPVRVMAWEPCITTFLVAPPVEATTLRAEIVPASAGVREAWRRLRGAAAPAPSKPDAADVFPPDRGPLGGWRLDRREDGVGFVAHPSGGDVRPVAFVKGSTCRILLAADVLASVPEPERRARLTGRFAVTETLALFRVSADPAQVRAGAPADPQQRPALAPQAFPLPESGFLGDRVAALALPELGVYELRASVVVRGALDENDAPVEKTATAALRFVVVENAVDASALSLRDLGPRVRAP